MKTKVIEFISEIGDGGAESLVRDYALLLDKDKFDVTIVCYHIHFDSGNYKILKENNVKMIALYAPFQLMGRALARIFGNRFVAFLFKKVLRKIKPDVIHTHLELLDTLYLSKEELDGVKLLFTCHNLPEMLIGDTRPKERDACKYFINNHGMQMIALHDLMKDEINKMFNINNTVVIRNGIDFKMFKNISASKEDIRAGLNISKDAYLVGHIGRFSYQKNQEFIIEIFNELVKKNSDARLLLVGVGKNKAKITKQISDYNLQDKVLLLSNRNDIPELFKAMDVFVFPSRFEGLGIVVIEAQVSNTKCVVSDNVPSDAYRSDLVSVLSLTDSKEKWVDYLLNPRSNISDYQDINEYDMNKVIKKLENLYLN